MLRYFEYLLFPCLNYQWVQKRNICLKLVNNRVVVSLFCFHFVFRFVFSLSILNRPNSPWDEIISRLFHLNEICDSIVSEQVSFRSRYQNVSGKSQKEEKVRLSVYYHMLFFEKQNAFFQHLSCLTNDDLSLTLSRRRSTHVDASKTQSKYVYATRVSVHVSIRCNITPKIQLVPQ